MSKVFWGVLSALFVFFVILPVGCMVVLPSVGNNLQKTFENASTQVDAKSALCTKPTGCSQNSGSPHSAPSENVWVYKSNKDEMRGTETRFASILSENELEFNFPYNGGSHGSISLRDKAGDLNVILEVEKGQFTCNSFSGDTISVKFDDHPIQRFHCTTSADGRSNVIFIENEKQFVAALKRSHRVIIEAQFFQEGNQQLTFNTAGLRW